MNIEADREDNQLEIIVELQDSKTKKTYYKKHFLHNQFFLLISVLIVFNKQAIG